MKNLNRISIIFAISLISLILLSSCDDLQYGKKTIRIAVSKLRGDDSYLNYYKWLYGNDQQIDLIDLYYRDRGQIKEILENCDGILLTGGPDIHPGQFGKPEEADRCSIDLKRDTLEVEMIKKALELDLPLMAICRGMQVLNVVKGGSLIIDIPEDFNSEIHQISGKDAMHKIKIEKSSLLFDIVGKSRLLVNSNHHQAIDELADPFVASAWAEDGIIEAYELKVKNNSPFLLGLEWHPERLKERSGSSKKIAEYFLKECRN